MQTGPPPDHLPQPRDPMPTTPCHAVRTSTPVTGSVGGRTPVALLVALALALVCGVTALGSTAPAHAHAGLVSSDPEEGSTLDTAPTEVTLTFNEEVRDPAFVVVTAPDGKQQESGKPTIDGEVVSQTLALDTEAAQHPGGAWTVAYRVVSSDGHTVQGHVRFRVTGEAPSPSSTASDTSDEGPATRPNGTDGDDETSNGAAPVVIAALLGLLLVVVTVTQKRRRKE